MHDKTLDVQNNLKSRSDNSDKFLKYDVTDLKNPSQYT